MARRAHEFLPKRPPRPEAVRWHVSDSEKATIKGVVCKCIKADKDGYIFQSIEDPKVIFAFTPAEYNALLDGQDFDLEPDGMNPDKAVAKLKAGVSSTKELSDREQVITDLREIAVWKFNELYKEDRTSKYRGTAKTTIKQEIQPYVNDEAMKMARDGVMISIKVPGPKKFLEWVRDYKKCGKLALVPGRRRSGNRKQRHCNTVYALALKHANRFLSPERPTAKLLYKDLKKEISDLNIAKRPEGRKHVPLPNEMACPDDEYFSKIINSLAPFDVDAARHLDEHARRRYHPSKGGVPNLTRPMQRVEADDWETHIHTLALETGFWEFISPELQAEAPTVRCVLSASICCVTRVLPAVVLSLEPNSSNTAQMLRMCMSDKTALAQSIGCETPYEYRGNPWTFVVDEGKALLNAKTQSICDVFAIEFLSPQIDTPQQRPKIERMFQTMEIRSLLRFSGRAFSNPVVRGKYEAAARACVTIAELAALILRFIVDEYHNIPHAGLDGETPRHCWLRLTKNFAPRSVPGKPLMRIGFGIPYQIILQPEGIEIFGNWYTSPKVEALFRDRPERDYTVMVDSEDLGGLSLQLDGGWLNVTGPAVMNGVSAAVWDVALAGMRREHKHIEKLVEPVVNRAIGFAQMADAETRKRLGIRYLPKTPEELEVLRHSIGRAEVRFAANRNPAPAVPVDIFSGAKAVGTQAPARPVSMTRPASAADSESKPVGKRTKPKAPRVVPAKPQSTTETSIRKPARAWKPKERK